MDLFAGCGGMTRGFVDSGRFAPVPGVEIDESAAATYAANFVAEGQPGKASTFSILSATTWCSSPAAQRLRFMTPPAERRAEETP
jgi:site-specific DNA-cytosine methylase